VNINVALRQGGVLLALCLGVSGQAFANTAAGATIHNAATVSWSGGEPVVTSVNVTVLAVAAMPAAKITSVSTKTVLADDPADYSLTLTSNSNGADTLKLADAYLNNNATGTPGITFLLNGNPVTSVNLDATVTSAPSTAGTVYIPAGSQSNIALKDVLSVNGNLYTVTGISAGTVASGANVDEVPTAVTLTPVLASPPITADMVGPGVQLGQQVTLTEHVVATAPVTTTLPATQTVSFTATTTLTDPAGTAVVYNSDSSSNNSGGATTVTSIVGAFSTLTKYVRNVTQVSANSGGSNSTPCGTTSNVYYAAGVTARSSDLLEYCLVAVVPSGAPVVTTAVLKDPLPTSVTYVPGSTSVDGVAVADSNGTSPLNSTAGLTVTSPNAAASGQIAPGDTVNVIFQATVQ